VPRLAHSFSVRVQLLFAIGLAGAGTGQQMLFSTPGAELPDVYLSKSVAFLEECKLGNTGACTNNAPDQSDTTYTVVLTHPPGMREDETVGCSIQREAQQLVVDALVCMCGNKGEGGGDAHVPMKVD
jgi:hypothetical protein